jgi:hypothetical protein
MPVGGMKKDFLAFGEQEQIIVQMERFISS